MNLAGGYMGKVLRIDLTIGKMRAEDIKESVLRKFIGGTGLAAKILYEQTGVRTDPLGPENVLMFMVGPFTATLVPSSGRLTAVAKSPLTGIWGESGVGGTWGTKLKKAGYDGVVVVGRASNPVYVWIDEDDVEIRSAAHVWGRDTFETDEVLREETRENATVACIGPSGEKLVRLGNILTDGKHARALGRCGLGAVMGSKNLKAIVVHGSKKPEVAHEDELMASVKELLPEMKKKAHEIKLPDYGTGLSLMPASILGDLPVRNWISGDWTDSARKISGEEMAETILVGRYSCAGCVANCGRVVKIDKGPYANVYGGGPEYETLGMLGANCMVSDIRAIAKANELCNRYGIDTISTGSVIAFAIEAYERGLINKKDTEGQEPRWGDPETLIGLIHKIGKREGLGRLLSEGVKRAANEIGGLAPEFAVHVKGLELPAHDPRARSSLAVGYAVSNRGACHLSAFTHDFESQLEAPELGIPEVGKPIDRFQDQGKGVLVAKFQDFNSMCDSLLICKFSIFFGATIPLMVKWLNYVTGWNVDQKEFLQTGARIFTLKRLYNIRLGVSRRDDTLPPRILNYSQKDGGAAGYIPLLNRMLHEHYEYRGWDEFGIPTPQTLRTLELADIL